MDELGGSQEAALGPDPIRARERVDARHDARRAAVPVIRRDSLRFHQGSSPGIFVAPIVEPSTTVAGVLAASIVHLRPGATTPRQRQAERVVHVLSGRGRSEFEDDRFEWEPGDSFHIKAGIWNRHSSIGPQPANLLIGYVDPLLEYMSPMGTDVKGDEFSDVPEDFEPEHPFGLGRQAVDLVGGTKWMSTVHKRRLDRRLALLAESREARSLVKWSELRVERSEHRGDFKVALVNPALGFNTRVLQMDIHQLPPSSATETHRHEEAIVYVLRGHGTSVIDDRQYEWRAGDCFHIQPGVWHRHRNSSPTETSLHIAIAPLSLIEHLGPTNLERTEGDSDGGQPEEGYVPAFPWEFEVDTAWPPTRAVV